MGALTILGTLCAEQWALDLGYRFVEPWVINGNVVRSALTPFEVYLICKFATWRDTPLSTCPTCGAPWMPDGCRHRPEWVGR